MKKMYLALMVLLCVGVNIFGMETKKNSWVFGGLSKEEQEEFDNDFGNGFVAELLISRYCREKTSWAGFFYARE